MRFPRLIAIAGLHLSVVVLSSATIIRSLEIAGNSVMSSAEITALLVSRSGAPWNRTGVDEDCRTVAGEYRTRGYLGVHVIVEANGLALDSAWIDLTIRVEEGKPSLLGIIAVEESGPLAAAEIRDRFDTRPGTPLIPDLLARDIDELLDQLDGLGYPYAACRVDTLAVNPGPVADTLSLGIAVAPGRLVRLAEVSVDGLRQTKPDVVIRETRIRPGEVYNPAKIRAVRQRLQRLDLFASVDEPLLYERTGRDGLLVSVREGNANTFDGVVGYLPASATGPGYVTGLVTIAMRNLFGTGRKLNIHWQREDRSSQELGFRYLEPWVLGQPVNLGAGFLQRQQDSTFVRRTMDASASLMFSEELAISLVVTIDRIIPSADSSGAGTAGSSSVTGGVEVLYDTRDDNFSPTSGVRYRADFHAGQKNATSLPLLLQGRLPASSTIRSLGVDLEAYVEPFRRHVIAAAVHGREVQTDHIQPAEMERFGGATTLRGYREREFLGSRVAWTNLEYRLLLGSRSSIYGFVDTGYFFKPADDILLSPAVEGFRAGYGLGMRVETPLGYLGVSYALGKGDSFGTGKVHISLNNDF